DSVLRPAWREARRLVAMAVLFLTGCASYGMHRPARVLDEGRVEVGISLDLVKFFSAKPPSLRSPEDLTQGLLLPTMNVRFGLPHRTELDLALHPGGLRVGGRAQVAGTERTLGALAAEAGVTLAWMIDVTEDPQSNVRFLLLP